MRIELAFPLTAYEIAEVLSLPKPKEDHPVNFITTDSRIVERGDLFWGLNGDRDNGANYYEEAVSRGAALLLGERAHEKALEVANSNAALSRLAAYYLQKKRIPVIAITGSVGKTGTKDAIAATLAPRYRVHKTEGNRNNDLGVAFTVLSRKKDSEWLVMELGTNKKGEIAEHARLLMPDIGVITAIGRAHIAAFGTKEAILEEKAALCEGMRSGTLYYNADDALLANYRFPVPSVGVGRLHAAEYTAEGIFSSRYGTSFTLKTAGESKRFFLRGAGYPRVYAALFAIAISQKLGISLSGCADALFHMRYASGRQEIQEANGVLLIDDTYNSSPEATVEALELLSSLAMGRQRYAVLGDMLELGEESRRIHAEIGEAVSKKADVFYAFGEFAEDMARAAREAGMPRDAVLIFKNAEEAGAKLLQNASDGDVILVKASRAMGAERIVTALRTRGKKRIFLS